MNLSSLSVMLNALNLICSKDTQSLYYAWLLILNVANEVSTTLDYTRGSCLKKNRSCQPEEEVCSWTWQCKGPRNVGQLYK